MSGNEKQNVIVVHEGLWQSVVSDIVTFGSAIATIYISSIFQMWAMTMILVTLWILLMVAKASNFVRGMKKMTVAEARLKLDEIERSQ